MTKFHLMPLMIPITPHTLVLPGTVPMAQRQQVIPGVLRWTTNAWSKAEYEKVQRAIEVVGAAGMDLEDFVMKLAEAVKKVIPDREFSISVGNFGIEFKPKEGKK